MIKRHLSIFNPLIMLQIIDCFTKSATRNAKYAKLCVGTYTNADLFGHYAVLAIIKTGENR